MEVKRDNEESRQYIWVVENPQGTEIALAIDTYKKHVIEDHPKDKARELSYPYVKDVIQKPRFIYFDQNHEKNKRLRYIDYVHIKEYRSIKSLVVVVDTDRTPHEVVTWMVKTNMKQEKTDGVIIYDSRENK